LKSKKVGIVGMGPAGLMAGTVLLQEGFEVHFFDHKKAAGRKFLVAGHGGFNLTHSESIEFFQEKYNHTYLKNAFHQFDNEDWRNWLHSKIGIETFVGSSGKIFPLKGIKPIEVLSNWLDKIISLGGKFNYSHKLIDFSEKEVVFSHNENDINFSFDYLVLALGGASWKKTGSTGEWKELLESKNIECINFEASNSGFEIENWQKMADMEGQTLKNTDTSFGSISRKGDVVISSYGLEGTPIYYVNKEFRENNSGFVSIDLKPTKTQEEIIEILLKSKNTTEGLKNLNLPKTAIQLLKKWTTKEEFSSVSIISSIIKNMKFKPTSLRPIDEVISTIGGISMASITEDFQLKNYPSIYCCGEMLDWDAPTGGYLIQGCVSSGFAAGKAISKQE
jgi:hypothetical protein